MQNVSVSQAQRAVVTGMISQGAASPQGGKLPFAR